MLRIHNTLSGQVEEFRPLVEGEVKFCYGGPHGLGLRNHRKLSFDAKRKCEL
jgi:hypothetical protein